MIKLQEVTKKWNEFACAAISAEYNTWEKVDVHTVAEELKRAIEQYVNELENEESDKQSN